ncbi:MAG: MBL fold metallo-hydrolase [Clostridia bacterium]|nr:MBL fold metallo-hydrolase [Clostridia bacterium]
MKTGRALMGEVLSTHPGEGEIYFWWLGQLGYLIRLGELTLMIDGFLTENDVRLQPSMIRPEELRDVDYILGTHDHNDHIDRIAWRVIAKTLPRARFIVPSPLVEDLCRDLGVPRERLIGVSEGKSGFEAPGIRVEGIAAAHETLDRDSVTGEYPYTGYVISGNGVKLYHSGDCVVYDGLERKLLDAGPFDAVFLPINGRDGKRFRAGCIGNMTFQEAVSLVCNLRPGLTVPGHYDMFPGNTINPIEFTDYLEAREPSLEYWLGSRGTRVRVARRAGTT